VSGGAVVQSTTQVKYGAYAAQATPNGVSTQTYLQSEFLQCLPGQSIRVSCWVWFTSAVTTNASLSVNWYTATGTYVSTASNLVSVPATTWTQLTNTYTVPTTGTLPYQFTINPDLTGTPASSQIWYVDAAWASNLVSPQLSSVVEITSPGIWPNQTWPPLGSIERA
jgi:hypothetical protein